ncbi:Lcl domain-containing protein [Desulfonema magnum]|uniref:DUF1566 n=1 Tax=Desulfonema magnum TaxID=45655 RepID=A0A975BLP4_9BACT|nr:DUF1566 domain-containing protein [Desulfonema magnum]QTA87766.1 DUF1566 [Desulfonema magnum]
MNASVSSFIKIITICLFFNCATVLAGERFTNNGDGTVTDHQLGVMWSETDNQGDINWKQAERWVKYTFPDTLEARYDNWRLPTLEELQSLYLKDENYKGYETDCGQQVRIVPHIKLSCGWLWTSEKKSITARVFNFNRGYHYTDRMVHKKAYRALPVRFLK